LGISSIVLASASHRARGLECFEGLRRKHANLDDVYMHLAIFQLPRKNCVLSGLPKDVVELSFHWDEFSRKICHDHDNTAIPRFMGRQNKPAVLRVSNSFH